MASNKKIWLKLKDDFFAQKEIKKLRQIAGGDTYVVIYLKLQLLSLANNGKIYFDGIEESFEKELALILDESASNVSVTLAFLNQNNLIEEISTNQFYISHINEKIGSESDSAERVRNYRQRLKEASNNQMLNLPSKSNAERQRAFRAKKVCELKPNILKITDDENKEIFDGEYYLTLFRDKYKCSRCEELENIYVYNLEEFAEKPEKEFNNWITLCKNCYDEKINIRKAEPIEMQHFNKVSTDSNEVCNADVTGSNDGCNDECNADVTSGNADKKECNEDVTQCNINVTEEIKTDKDTDIKEYKCIEKENIIKVGFFKKIMQKFKK